MKKNMSLLANALVMALGLVAFSAQAETTAPAKPVVHAEYKDWRVIGLSHRLENQTMRLILGNQVAMKAVRGGKIETWPDGSILAKVIWKERTHPNWPQAVIPGEFSAAEAMVKDSKKYAQTGGWGFGHWVDGQLAMYDEAKSATCFACHTAAKQQDYVFNFAVMP